MLSLALAYMRERLGTTLVHILLLALAVASLVVLLLVSTQVADRFARDAAGVDLVVGAKGSPLQLILSSVYHLDAPTGNIPLETIDLLRRDPLVARAIPLALGDNFRGFRIVGTDPSFLGLKGAMLGEGRMWEAPYEVVIGAAVARATGAGIGQKFVGSHGLGDDADGAMGHDHAPFVVTGILKSTGSVVDRLILTSVESVWGVHGIAAPHEPDDHGEEGHAPEGTHGHDHEHEHEHEHDADTARPILEGPSAPAAEVTAVLVSYRSPAAAIRLPAAINRQTALQAAVPAQETARFLTLFDGAIAGARLFGWLIAGAGALSIFTVLLSAARAREGDMALLRVMGATRGQVFGTILLEGVLTAAAGGLLGILLAHLLVGIAVRSSLTLSGLGLSGLMVHPAEAAILGGALLLGVLAALLPAARVFRQDLATTLARAQ
jgi:putative ABC transport system permease protein